MEKEQETSAAETQETAITDQAITVQEQASETPPAPQLRSRKYIEEVYPDRTFGSDEEYDNALMEHMEGNKAKLAENDEANKSIAEILFDHPEFAEIIEDLKSGVPFKVALAKHFDPEELTVGDDEPEAEQYRQAAADRRRRYEESQTRIREREENTQLTVKEVEQFLEATGWDEEKSEAFLGWMQETVDDFARGKITKTVLGKMRQAFEYEEAVAEARTEGEIEGRNATIEARREKKTTGGDGLPTGGAGAVSVEQQDVEEKDFFDDVLEARERRKW